MWQLYKILKTSIPEKDEEFLIMEVIRMMESMNNSSFKDALQVMYAEGFHLNKSPNDLALLFIKGIKKSNLFTFSDFIKSLSHDPTK